MKLFFTVALMSLLTVSCGNPHISSSKNGLERTNPPATPDDEGGVESGDTTGGGTSGSTTGSTTGGTVGGSTTGSTTGGTVSGSTTGGTIGGSTTGGTSGGSTGGQTCIPSSTTVTGYRFYFGSQAAGELNASPAEYNDIIKCKTTVNETFNSFTDGLTKLISNSSRGDYSYDLIHQTEKHFLSDKAVYLEDVFGTDTYTMEIEKPVSQNGATGKDRGVDSHSADRETKDAFVWSFSSPIAFFGGKFVDVESSPSEPAKLRLYNCDRVLIKETNVVYPNGEQGQKQLHFIGFISQTANICHVSLTVGDYEKPAPWASRAFFRALAIDGFNYGK